MSGLLDRLVQLDVDRGDDAAALADAINEASREELLEAWKEIIENEILDYDRNELRECLAQAWINGSKALADYTDDEIRQEIKDRYID